MNGDGLPITLRVASINSPAAGPVVPVVSLN
jgi:hypothetical protein